jgi:5'(3')-deoxyribonucleotidase
MDRPIIYFDLDGVLADFEKGFHRMTGIDLALLGPDAFADKETKDAVFQHPTFFLDLELMPGAKDLVNYAQGFQADIKVLTATGYSNEDAVDAQKRAWVKKHFGDLEVHTVPKSEMKAKFAWPIDILIDDRLEKSIIPFREKGGIGIHHTHPAKTKVELDRVWKEMEEEPTPKPSWHTTEGWHSE